MFVLLNTVKLSSGVLKNSLRLFSTSSEELVVENLVGKYEGVTVFGLKRPERKNALGVNIVNRIDTELENVDSDAKARVLIIRSLVSGIFCSGADLKERRTMTANDITQFLKKLNSITNKIQHLRIPVIAAMDGGAFGGGLELALSCDLRIVSSCMKLGLTETKLAIIPGAGGTQRLPRLLNPAIAKELIFTGRVISGSEAHHLGMVNRAVPQNANQNSAYLESLNVCEEILQNGPVAVRMAKIAINRGLETDLDTGLAIEKACYAQVVPTKDRLEALEAFQSKRKPNFKGE